LFLALRIDLTFFMGATETGESVGNLGCLCRVGDMAMPSILTGSKERSSAAIETSLTSRAFFQSENFK
jgi:hypothetical protein